MIMILKHSKKKGKKTEKLTKKLKIIYIKSDFRQSKINNKK